MPGITADAADARARLMIMISTRSGPQEQITPEGIARGQGDAWLISLQNSIAASGLVTYVRLMAEMDGYWNAFSAFNANGTPARRGPFERRVQAGLAAGDADHARREPRRTSTRSCTGSGIPPLHASGDLPTAKVAMLWVPQVAPGDPDVPGNQPSDYWPGRAWVDWVGTDFYSFAQNFSGLSAFYDAYPGFPFVFGEYAVGETSDDPGFIDALFGWAASHPRVRMMIYNMGIRTDGPFRLSRYPQSARALRQALAALKVPGVRVGVHALSSATRGAR